MRFIKGLFLELKKYRDYFIVRKYAKLRKKTNKYRVMANNSTQNALYVRKILMYYKLRLSRLLLLVLYIYPVKKNKIVFMSYNGDQYACNPKKLTEYLLQEHNDDLEIVWILKRPERFNKLKSTGIRLVKHGTRDYYKELLTAKVFVHNMRIQEGIPFRKNQITISTGHGGGAYKKLLLDMPGITDAERKMVAMSTQNTTTYVSSCKDYSKYVVRGAYNHKGMILECGMPRNDDLINNIIEPRQTVRDYYDLPSDVKILMYAPTYRRGTRMAADYDFDALKIKNAAEKRFGGEWVVMYRLHHFIRYNLHPSKSQLGIIDATNYKDMQELIIASDILVTDYSSSVWDYSLTGKPCFLYAVDLEGYLETQGFYTSIFDWPFPLAESNESLEQNILNFDEKIYLKDIKKHHTDLGIVESGKATETIGEYIYRECI